MLGRSQLYFDRYLVRPFFLNRLQAPPLPHHIPPCGVLPCQPCRSNPGLVLLIDRARKCEVRPLQSNVKQITSDYQGILWDHTETLSAAPSLLSSAPCVLQRPLLVQHPPLKRLHLLHQGPLPLPPRPQLFPGSLRPCCCQPALCLLLLGTPLGDLNLELLLG